MDPTRPTTSASIITERVIWPRLAPIARSRASSRPRWATRIEKVLTMMKEPTSRAMPAKTSRKVVMKPSASCTCVAVRSATAAPVSAVYPFGVIAAASFATSAGAASSVVVSHTEL